MSLETFPNPASRRDYAITIHCTEFTCVCPRTGQPDYARLTLEYVPERLCVELKSLKLYLQRFRNEGHFHEAVTNRIADDLIRALAPRRLRLLGEFNLRGGIHTDIEVRHEAKNRRKR